MAWHLQKPTTQHLPQPTAYQRLQIARWPCVTNDGSDCLVVTDRAGPSSERIQVREPRADTVKAKGGLAWLMASENCKRGLPAEKLEMPTFKSQ